MVLVIFWHGIWSRFLYRFYSIFVTLFYHQLQKDRSRRLFGVRQNRENWKWTKVSIFVFWGFAEHPWSLNYKIMVFPLKFILISKRPFSKTIRSQTEPWKLKMNPDEYFCFLGVSRNICDLSIIEYWCSYLHQFQKDRSRRLFGVRQNRENWKWTPVNIFVFLGFPGTSVTSHLRNYGFSIYSNFKRTVLEDYSTVRLK